MIVYSATKAEFKQDVYANKIEQRVLSEFRTHIGHGVSGSEFESWKNSLNYMNNVLEHADIPDDAGVAIEYQIPLTSKRVDFILSGLDGEQRETVVIVELKQWSEVQSTQKDAIVKTALGGGLR